MKIHMMVAAIALSSALGLSAMESGDDENYNKKIRKWVGGRFPLSGVFYASYYEYTQNPLKERPLIQAVSKGNRENMERLLASKQVGIDDKTPYGHTALDIAVSDAIASGKYEIVEWLITRGANINTQDNSGANLLVTFACAGKHDKVKEFIQRGVKVNTTREVEQLLMQCHGEKNRAALIKILVDDAGLDQAVLDEASSVVRLAPKIAPKRRKTCSIS